MSDKPFTLGMVGENVAALHQALSERGFAIAEAETQKQFFGPATRIAVGEFQRANGIDPSCEVCKKTAAKLEPTRIASDAANYNQPPVQTFSSRTVSATNYNQPLVQTFPSRTVSAANYNQPLVQTFSSQVGTGQQTSQPNGKRKTPTHLSVFALAKSTGHPIARMPFYAEVGVVSVLPQPKCDLNLQKRIQEGIWKFLTSTSVDSSVSIRPAIRPLAQELVEPLCDALYRLLAPVIVNQWMADQESFVGVIAGILQTASELAKARSMDWNNPQMLGQLLEEAILAYAKENKLPLAEANAQGARIAWAHPMGVLATDHVGYLSFDLTRLPEDVADAVALALEERRRDPNTPTATSIWIYPMAQEERRIDALEQMRFADDAIVVRLGLDVELDPELCQPKLCESIKNLGLMAMQNPSLTDWRLSPASFATNPSALIGSDGCENLLPANVALQEFYFYQVVSLSDIKPTGLAPDIEGKVKFGIAHEYRLAWYSIGHSLGQIQYSLPLAPGESVNLAVIDWTRRDVGSRTEDTTASEQLVHNQRRDRTIAETVNAAIKEYQEGSSFMAGLAQSTGVAGAVGKFGVAAGLAGSLGGSSSDSEGSRTIAADTVQKLSDNITQSSAAMRELQSTVVVQTTQSEKESIETRTVVNYNHSHALTILYYEVLRHFRVVTEYVRSRPIVLAKLDTDFLGKESLVNVPGPVTPSSDPEYISKITEFILKLTQNLQTIQNLLENRPALEAALLDKRHTEGFNALQRVDHRHKVAAVTPSPPSSPSPAGPSFQFFTFDMMTGGIADENKDKKISIKATLWPGDHRLNDGMQLNQPGAFTAKNFNDSFTASLPSGIPPVPWASINMIMIEIIVGNQQTGPDISFQRIKITGLDENNLPTVLVDKNYGAEGGHLIIGSTTASIPFPTSRPPVPPPAPPPSRPVEEIEDDAKVNELIDHLRYHRAHYSRALYLNQNTAERARQLDGVKLLNDATLLEKVENRPLEMIGDFVAYPCADSTWVKIIKDAIDRLPPPDLKVDERLSTLPTRGLFAEAKLGHCNASEEIDNTRFWDWQQSPIPHMAPEIAPIQAVTPQPQQPDLSPTPFPQSLVNIVNPPAAPDPTGLSTALNVLGTPNIFRDMSGRAEVADLLKKLSDNSISIAEAANRAREIQAKYGKEGEKGDGSRSSSGMGGGRGSTSSIGGPRARPTESSAVNRDLHDSQNILRKAVDKGLLSPQDASSKYKQLMNEFGVTPERQSIFDNPNAIASNDPSFVPPESAPGSPANASNAPKMKSSYRKTGFTSSTGLGKFDVVEYLPDLGILTITVRPRFTFEPFNPATGTDPEIVAQWPTFLKNVKRACKDTFQMMVEAWGGWHHFVCIEPGLTNLHARVVCKVDELPTADLIIPGTAYTPVIFGNMGNTAHAKISINVDHSAGYSTSGGITAMPIRPSEYLSAALGMPPKTYNQYIIMHELGHIFGLGDEYVSKEPTYAQGMPTQHSSLANRELNKNVFHGWNDKSIMATGGEILDVHGVTFLEALRDVTGLKWKLV